MDSAPNRSLIGFQLITAVKSVVEKYCPNKVSCADILALVARDAVEAIGGPFWPVPLGRRDGKVSIAFESLINLPLPSFNASQLVTSFGEKGLSAKDLVVLSGAHTIGISHCTSFSNRLYNFTGRGDSDPSLDADYVRQLKIHCPPGNTVNVVDMDRSKRIFDIDYYSLVQKNKGLFTSDAALLNNTVTNKYVQSHATASGQLQFFKDFARSMGKMGKIGVLTGTEGEIRRICSAIN